LKNDDCPSWRYDEAMPWRRAPVWLSLGGAWLALNAGYINAVGFLGTTQHGLTHITGQVTRIGIRLAEADAAGVGDAALLVIWFFAGAVVSGALIRRPEVSERGRRYGVAMLVEAALLAVATVFIARGDLWAANLVAMAAGLQNAMATSYSGAVVRTTHMTGIATDMGILVGHALRGHPPEWGKLRLLATLFGGFLAGGGVGALVFPALHEWALLPSVGALVVGAFISLSVSNHPVPESVGQRS
jgi:uncharacterized membrane protein YoaK (UPF0700 family)